MGFWVSERSSDFTGWSCDFWRDKSRSDSPVGPDRTTKVTGTGKEGVSTSENWERGCEGNDRVGSPLKILSLNLSRPIQRERRIVRPGLEHRSLNRKNEDVRCPDLVGDRVKTIPRTLGETY